MAQGRAALAAGDPVQAANLFHEAAQADAARTLHDAELAAVTGPDTWRQWRYDWGLKGGGVLLVLGSFVYLKYRNLFEPEAGEQRTEG